MLESRDREKIEQYISKLTGAISADVHRNIQMGMSNRDIIDNAIRLTVNKITPESKMILSSVYNMLLENTFADSFYQDPKNKAAFYERDILSDLTANFSFEVPNHIDYEETQHLINKWTASGAVVVAGGVISITMKNIVPIAVAVVLAGIMLFLMKDKPVSDNRDVNALTTEYLEGVRDSLLAWIHEIEKYYDAEVYKLEKELK